MTIASKLETINEALSDIKSSIVAKGVTPTGDITTYSTAIESISTGDEITATNTTGSTVSADDRVWVNGEDVYTRDFTGIYGSPVINDTTRILESKAGNYGYIYKELTNIAPQSSYEQVVKIKYDSYLANYQFNPVDSYDSSLDINADGINIRTGSSVLYWFVPGRSLGLEASPSLSSLTVGNFYWFKLSITTEGAVASYSTDGITYTNITTVSDATLISNSVYSNSSNKYFILGGRGTVITIDLGGCYIKVDGTIVWTPYTTSTTYSIINDTDITSTSFTGVAQEAIANNATGSVKTLLDGNGTYAPTTATKSITTNGTYTASAENAYGLSEVTVNVPTPDVWHNWKNTEYTSDFSTTGTVSINNRILSINNTWNGADFIYKQLNQTLSSSDIEIVVKLRNNNISTGNGMYVGLGLSTTSSWYNTSKGVRLTKYVDYTQKTYGWGISSSSSTTTIYATNINAVNDTWYWLKLVISSAGVFSPFYSTDGSTWIAGQSSYTQTPVFDGSYFILGNQTDKTSTIEYDLSECYVKVNGEIIWTPYSETSSEAYTLTASPTTSTQVYEIPKKTSALTITAVGTGTITLSDSKVYNRNSAGDVESPVLGTKTITSNNTYTAASDYLDGFSSVTVNVPSSSGIGIPREIVSGTWQFPSTLTSFSLPSNVTDVGDSGLAYAFYYCTTLTSVDLSSLTTVSGGRALEGAFYGCTALTSVDLSSLTTVSGIGAFVTAFRDCTGLTSVDLSSLTTVSGFSAFGKAFQNCTGLTSVSFPSLATVSGGYGFTGAFSGCTALTSVSFPSLTTTSFGSYKNQFNSMLSNTGTTTTHTLHFPSNLQTTISGLQGYPNFGGTSGYVTCLFDLPATS